MKKLLFVLSLLLQTALFSQTVPKGISYQAVAINTEAQSVAGINPENTYWSNKDIQVRFTIYDQYPGGSAQMVETHQTKTDKFGVFNLVIGQGQNISGDLFEVEWDKGQAHLQVEIDFNNNGLYKLIGIERFWSVPYAFNTQSSDALTKNLDSLNADLNDKIKNNKDRIDDHIQNDLDTSSQDETQFLSINRDTIFISGGNNILLPNDEDIDSTNEIQEIELKGDEIVISKSKGGIKIDSLLKNMNINTIRDTLLLGIRKVYLSDLDSLNEIQTINIKGDTIALSKGGGEIVLPKDKVFDGDSSVINEIQDLYVENDTIKISKSTGDGIAIDDLKIILDSLTSAKSGGSSSPTSISGVNGTVNNMWFGTVFKNNPWYLHKDTGYFFGGGKLLTEKPGGKIDTLFSIMGGTKWMNYPFIYADNGAKKRIYHADSGYIKDASFSQTARLTILNNGNAVALDRGNYSYEIGDIHYYNYKTKKTFTIRPTNYNGDGLFRPQVINDSLVLIGHKVYKYDDDTLMATSQAVPHQYRVGSYSNSVSPPLVGNDRYIIFDIASYQSKGTSAGWWRSLQVLDVLTGKKIIIEHLGGQSPLPDRKYALFGVTQNKVLVKKDGEFLWLDLNNLTLTTINYRPGNSLNTTNASEYKRIGLQLGKYTNNSGFVYEYYPNINYTKPKKGYIWLHY